MKRFAWFALFCLVIGANGLWLYSHYTARNTGAPPYGEPERAVPEVGSSHNIYNWQRPEGPTRVGIQVGHWKNAELPDELSRLIGNTGASGGGKSEAEVNLEIALLMAGILRSKGVVVDILPATIPPSYVADAFLAIHADGSTDPTKSGFKMAAPWRDLTRKANRLVALLETDYQQATNMDKDPNITRNMRGYYAFSWWRFKHAVHPMTPSVIVETGFLTSPQDRELIVDQPEISAQALAKSVLTFLEGEDLL